MKINNVLLAALMLLFGSFNLKSEQESMDDDEMLLQSMQDEDVLPEAAPRKMMPQEEMPTEEMPQSQPIEDMPMEEMPAETMEEMPMEEMQ